ncbi:hypothetical protein B4P00_22005 [Shewanella xiamenensis]|jgi:hypothetical protein|uniref:hypothetical protein n=1 Tax=Shewanella xiamenensis TaxID=332186 RepID=UPI000849DF10|nr:hypothetical protein [Shewanella xiamenensis]MBW0298844.1 hypothetical protein [Shewanella xiamenensis]ODR83785.1 hypothetical protein ABT47_23800 [Shewanella xiamenensis]
MNEDKPKLEALFKELSESDGRSGKGASIFSMITRAAAPPVVVIGGLLIIGDFPFWFGLVSIIGACIIGVAWGISLDKQTSPMVTKDYDGLTCDGVPCSKKETIFTSMSVFIAFVIMCISLYVPYYFYNKIEPPKLNYKLTTYATEHYLTELKLYNVISINFINSELAPRIVYKTNDFSEDYHFRWKDSSVYGFYGYVGNDEVAIVTTPNTNESIDYVASRIGIAIEAVIDDIKEKQRKDSIKREWERSERVEAN